MAAVALRSVSDRSTARDDASTVERTASWLPCALQGETTIHRIHQLADKGPAKNGLKHGPARRRHVWFRTSLHLVPPTEPGGAPHLAQGDALAPSPPDL